MKRVIAMMGIGTLLGDLERPLWAQGCQRWSAVNVCFSDRLGGLLYGRVGSKAVIGHGGWHYRAKGRRGCFHL